MAFPPAPLPTNRTNATPQNNTHPADHNAISAAINDTVFAVQTLQINTANQGLAALGTPSMPGSATDTIVTYTSLSTAAWGTGVPFNAPAGTIGYYMFTLNVTGPTVSGAGERVRLKISTPAGGFQNYIPAGETTACVVAGSVLNATNEVYAAIRTPNTQVGAQVYTVRFEISRVSI